MKTGAVALIDALGFRGIWKRNPPEKVLAKMKALRKSFLSELLPELHADSDCDFNCEIAFLSDTIAVSLSLHDPAEGSESVAIQYLAIVLSGILNETLQTEIPISYRGAVAYGNHVVEDQFLMGAAIDEAVDAMNLPQAAIVMLTPGASGYFRNAPLTTALVKYPVPIKGGETLETYTVSPIRKTTNEKEATVIRNMLDSFTEQSIDVAVKRQNTLKHLKACCQVRGVSFPDMGNSKI